MTYLLCFFSTVLLGETNSVAACEVILAKETLSRSDFQALDSIIFGINFYNSDVPRQLYIKARNKAAAQKLPKFYLQFDIMLSELFYETDKMDSCVHYAKRAASLAKELGEEIMFARSTNILRITYTLKNNYTKAYKICYEALEIFEKNSDLNGMGVASRDIGGIMLLEKKYDDALNYNLRSASFLEESENWFELQTSYQRLAMIYCKIKKFELANEYCQKSIAVAKKLSGFRRTQGLIKKYWTLGYVYEEEEKYKKALMALDSSRLLAKEISYRKDHFYLNAQGSIYLKSGEYDKALKAFEDALEYITSVKNRQNGYDYYVPIFSNLVESYEGLDDYKTANYYLKKIAADKDSIFTISSEKQVAELQTKYETSKKEAQIIQLESDKLIQRNLIYSGGIALLALSFAALLLFRNNRFKLRTNKQLKLQKAEIEAKNVQNELLLKEIHHRVKNNLQTVSSLLSLQSESITDPNAISAVQESKNRVKSMALIHQKLYQGENLASIEMGDYFKIMGSALIDSFGENADNVSLDVQIPEIELDVDTAIPLGLITNELITNSLKYAFPNNEGQISIKLKKINALLNELTISDDGTPTQESRNSSENGFGTLLIQLLTTQLGGELEMSNLNGTTAILRFPNSLKSVV